MPLLDPLTNLAPAATATGMSGNRRLDLVFATPATGGTANLWHKYWLEDRGWTPSDGGWFQRGGLWGSAVTAVAFSGGRLDVFGLGTDDLLYHATALGDVLDGPGTWRVETVGRPPGRTILSSPTAITRGPTDLLVAVRTRQDDSALPGVWFASLNGPPVPGPLTWRWRRHLNAAHTWPSAHSRFATAPGLAWRKPGSVDLLVVDDRYRLEHAWLDGDVAHDWEAFSEGGLTSSPSATPWWEHDNPELSSLHIVSCYGPFELEPGAVVLKSWLGKHWEPPRFIYVDGTTERRGVQGPPAVTSWGKPYLDVFFLTAADRLGGDLAMTHGSSTDGRHFTWERLRPPPFR